jgi:hypothetical protein
VRRFIFFHNRRHPAELDTTEVTDFLTYLAGPAAETLGAHHKRDDPSGSLRVPRPLRDHPATSPNSWVEAVSLSLSQLDFCPF